MVLARQPNVHHSGYGQAGWRRPAAAMRRPSVGGHALPIAMTGDTLAPTNRHAVGPVADTATKEDAAWT
jgi:hypothetical protein